MKKIFYYLMCAVVAMGAMACQNDVDTDITPNENSGEKVSFVAEIGEATRVDIGDKVDGKYPITLDADDKLIVKLFNGGELGGTEYTFTTADGKNFECTTEGVSELLNQEVYVYYNHTFCSMCGIEGIDLNGTGTLSEGAEISLKVMSPVLMFESDYDVTFNSQQTGNPEEGIFSFCDDHYTDDMKAFTIPASEGVHYIAVVGGAECTFSYSIDGVKCKEITTTFEPYKIYNLGTLSKTIYLVPDMWAADGAWFSAHFFNSTSGYDNIKMTDDNTDGIYECNVPVGMESVIFCRMNPAYDTFGWNDETDTNRVWDQSENLTIGEAPNNYYYITDWQAGEWNVKGYDPKAPIPSTPDEASPWSLSGTFNSWGDAAMVTTSIKDIFVVKDVTLDAYASFKVRKDKKWDENYGGGIVYMNPNGYIKVYSNGSDICNTAAGAYDVYFDYTNKLLYLVNAGTDYATVAEQTVEGEEPEVEEPEVTENVLYLKPNSNWTQANARFAAYFFGKGDKWVSMTDSDSDGIYEVNIPEGYTFGDNIIFCRMNPSTSSNSWNNKWNQTADLKIPTDGKNLYTVTDGYWDSSDNNQWSVKK